MPINVQINELPAVGSLNPSDVLPAVAGATTSQITVQNLANSLTQVSSSISASYSIFADGAATASYAVLAGQALNAFTASYVGTAISSSYPFLVSGSNIFSPGAGRFATVTKSFLVGNGAGFFANGNNNVFIGDFAGYLGYTDATFIGYQAGYYAQNARESNFLGYQAGYEANYSRNSNFLGSYAGYGTYNAAESNFLGAYAGFEADYANNSNFIGDYAGYEAGNANYSNFIGANAGMNAGTASYSNFIGRTAGREATYANHSNFIGDIAGYQAVSASDANFIGPYAGYQATNATASNFLGARAGYQATNAGHSNFLGVRAGYGATEADFSNFIGYEAGRNAPNSYNSNFIGIGAGQDANYAYEVNYIGSYAGYLAGGGQYSNFIGYQAGYEATNAYQSIFVGSDAGNGAIGAYNSIFIGGGAGYDADDANHSILIGTGAGAKSSGNGLNRNNIVLGNKITLPNNSRNAVNIGGLVFGTGSYADMSAVNSFSGSANGRVGINQPTPIASLDVSGSGRYTGGLTVTGSLLMSGSIIPATATGDYTSSFSLGSSTAAWKDLWVSNGTIYFLNGAGAQQGVLSSTANGLQLGDSIVSGSLYVRTPISYNLAGSDFFVAEYQGKPSKALAIFSGSTWVNGDLIASNNVWPVLPFDKKYNAYFIQNNGDPAVATHSTRSLTLSLPPWANTRLAPGETVTVYNMSTGSAGSLLNSGNIYIVSTVQQVNDVALYGVPPFYKRISSTTNNGVLLSGSWMDWSNINPTLVASTSQSIRIEPGQKGIFELVQFPDTMGNAPYVNKKFEGDYPTSGSIDDTYLSGLADYRMAYVFRGIENI